MQPNAAMPVKYVNAILAALPAYVEVVVTLQGLKKPQRLMARDLPGSDRRFTNLDSGTEWFLPFDGSIGLEKVEFPALNMEVLQ